MDKRHLEYYIQKICEQKNKCLVPFENDDDYLYILAAKHIMWLQRLLDKEYDVPCFNNIDCPPSLEESYNITHITDVIYKDGNIHALLTVEVPHLLLTEYVDVDAGYITYDIVYGEEIDVINIYVDTSLIGDACNNYTVNINIVGRCASVEIPVSFRLCDEPVIRTYDVTIDCCRLPLMLPLQGVCPSHSGVVRVVENDDTTVFKWDIVSPNTIIISLIGDLSYYNDNGIDHITLILEDVPFCDGTTANITVNATLLPCVEPDVGDFCTSNPKGCKCEGIVKLFKLPPHACGEIIEYSVDVIVGRLIYENIRREGNAIYLYCPYTDSSCFLAYIDVTYRDCCGTHIKRLKISCDGGRCRMPVIRFSIASGTDIRTLPVGTRIAKVECEGICITSYNVIAKYEIYCGGSTPPLVRRVPLRYNASTNYWILEITGDECNGCSEPSDVILTIEVYDCAGTLITSDSISVICG